MIKIGQFSTSANSSIVLAGRIALHLRNQKAEKLLPLQKRFCTSNNLGSRVVFIESLLLLYTLGKIEYDAESDKIIFDENT